VLGLIDAKRFYFFEYTGYYAPNFFLSGELLHYHNYFARNMPDPFSNSTPSLVLPVFLVAILILNFHRMNVFVSSGKKPSLK